MAVRIASQAEPIPGYKLIERLGGGGFGEVWKAVAPGGLLKAIKFVYGDLQASNEEGLREQELKALSRVKSVRHPYILSLERYDILEGQLVIVMELADRNLYDRLKDCRSKGLTGIPREELLRYMEESAEALDLMNIEYQLQHLDIKPQNIFLIHNHVKVADFGLVKDLAGMMASLTGGVTPVYAAPETFDGWVSRFCDQYSLAIVYQELLTGVRPFTSTSVAQLIQQHLKSAPNLTPLPPTDREIIGKSLAKNPDERYPSCLEMIRALRAAGPETSRLLRAGPPLINQGPMLAPPLAAPEPTGDGVISRVTDRPSNGTLDANARDDRAHTGNTQWIQAGEKGDEKHPTPAIDMYPAREEQEGTGSLMPALVIGLGSLGLGVLRRLRGKLHERFNDPEAPACLRLLYLDTDPDAFRQATQGDPVDALTAGEVIQTKLNRPSHYLRSTGNKTRVEGWLNPKMLYRIPRNLVTTGLRVLGRLAFLDNYRMISRRLQAELEACCNSETVLKDGESLGLGLRTTRPRVYVIAGLAGGSGSGMFLDVAYVLRRLLRHHGYEQPEIIGIFLIPPVDRHPGRTLGLGNTFAALTELNHYSAPGTSFVAHYDERERAISNSDAPFSRCILLQLPDDGDARSFRELLGQAADYLYRNLATPLGRTTDESRDQLSVMPRQPWGMVFQTFGSFRVTLPRRALVQKTASELCLHVVERWLSKDAKPVHDEAALKVTEEWARLGLSADEMIEQLQQSCEATLGKTPEAFFSEITEPLTQLDFTRVDEAQQAIADAFQQLDDFLGRPDACLGTNPGKLVEPLTKASGERAQAWGQQLVSFVAGLIEDPNFRLAGAEEAVREMLAVIEQVLAEHDPLLKEITTRAQEARVRILSLLDGFTATGFSRKIQNVLPNLVELLRAYPRWRLQSLVLTRAFGIYVSLRGGLSDQLREMNYCRDRLVDVRRAVDNSANDTPSNSDTMLTRALFPEGRRLSESVERVRERFTADDIRELDRRIQVCISEHFTGLLNLCLGPVNRLKELERAMTRLASEFVSQRLTNTQVADNYLAQYEKDDQVRDDLASMYAEAAPRLSGSRPQATEIAVMAAPDGPAGSQIRLQARRALADADLIETVSEEDIVFYRERTQMILGELDQLGPLAYEAYKQVGTVDQFTPHSRTDIAQWRAAAVN